MAAGRPHALLHSCSVRNTPHFRSSTRPLAVVVVVGGLHAQDARQPDTEPRSVRDGWRPWLSPSTSALGRHCRRRLEPFGQHRCLEAWSGAPSPGAAITGRSPHAQSIGAHPWKAASCAEGVNGEELEEFFSDAMWMDTRSRVWHGSGLGGMSDDV